MRLNKPRIGAIQDADLTPEQAQALSPVSSVRPAGNVFRTLAHAPEALSKFLEWGGYVLSKRNSLSPRQREIVILRVGFLCKSGYEFMQHAAIGKRAGLTDAEIAAIKAGAGAAGWSSADAALIRAADELVGDFFIADATWAALGQHFDDKQRMDVVLTAGQYVQVSMILNSFGVQLEPGVTLDPDLKAY